MKPEFKNTGSFLKEHRLRANFTQSELAAKLGSVHSQFISNWERGHCAPSDRLLHKLISLLRMNRAHLIEAMLEDEKEAILKKVFSRKKSKR